MLTLAATMYFFQLGRAGLDDAETYSAYIASRPTVREVFRASLNLDPGKGGGLYVFALHFYCEVFGTGEAALRAFSAVFALASVMLLFVLARELFGVETAIVATALWAFNPMALIVARWARMYSMFIALTLGSLLAMLKVQQRPTVVRVAMFGVLGAAMLHTHLGGALVLGAEVAILARDRWRGRAVGGGCLGIAIALILFAPIAPSSFAQVHASALGHRFDWIGSAPQTPLVVKAAGSLIATAVGLLLVLGPAMPFDNADSNPPALPEPLRWCAMWTVLPLLALAAGSLMLHPMFELRYIAPVTAGFAMLTAAAIEHAGARFRNLVAVAMTAAFVVIAIMFQRYHRPFDLWRRIAHEVAATNAPSQEVFFEAGYVMSIGQSAGLDPDSLVEVLPDGYLRIPFDYYSTGTNRRRAINPFRPALARDAITEAARHDGGAWLVSHLGDEDLRAELPLRDTFESVRVIYDESVSVSLYHIVPRAKPR